MRTCKNCGERKTFASFKKDKNAPSRRSHICKACENAIKREEDEATHFEAYDEIETRNDANEDVQ